ncbi:sigma-70 family RNA polymerase sigma factor [Persicimonas caeni]|uniref:Sigma-70 family RNA polymerase sigma factor n=1 Tax=Persicimonas caeni TaxID=2292766 RepID=A0A4Y6PMM5_PERCE|nr:sigma-70 family RNA polymerase sigma factor [Persicimonas caeni]QDG49473.1 sigma-70 family RNA polymerase sigma factor [Persicimonas caeni]QED30694.1 sigma-70 family RNA polymerase sigma factor [Persicimonas caeni]
MAIDTKDYYERYGPMVLRRCRALLRNEDDALDAMQETFVKVLENEERLSDDAPSSLLYRMATNVCLNRIRAASRRPEVAANELVYEIAQLGDAGGRTEARNFLHRIFRREKASTRQIAALYWLEDRTYQEVADEVGMSVSGVRKRLRQLRQSLERQGLELRG